MTEGRHQEIFATSDNIRSDKHPLAEYRYIGKRNVRRNDGYEKASGHAIYTMDVNLPGMLHMRFLTSPYPHAAIVKMDTRQAEALPGVRAVLRYDDPELPAEEQVYGHPPCYRPVLAQVAHFEGEEVGAAVAADTEAIAEEALRLIDIEWEQREFILDPVDGAKPDAILTNPEEYPGGNHFNEGFLDVDEHGDIEKGMAEADITLDFTLHRSVNTWIGPERPCGVFRWNGQYPEVWVKQQRPQLCKKLIANWFGGIPMNKITIHALYQGASFGGWSQVPWNMGGHYCAALVAKRLGKPVKWSFSRREDFHGGQSDCGTYTYRVGVKNDGTITAVEATTIQANMLIPVFGVAKHVIENTNIENVYGKTIDIWVNKGVNVPTRCEQNPNCYTMSYVFNRVADALNIDPTELAIKHDGAEGHDMAWLDERKAEMGFAVRDSLRECLAKGKAAIDWDGKYHAPATRKLANGRMHGMSFVWTHEWEDSAGSAEMGIRLEPEDGTATIFSIKADVGVNSETAFCQTAADEIGLRVEDVFYKNQVDAGFYAMTPDSSTSTTINVFAVRNAARKLKREILFAATRPSGHTQRGAFPAAFLGVTPEELDIKDSVIFVRADPSRRLSVKEFVRPMGIEGPSCYSPEMGEGAERCNFTVPLFAHGWAVQQGAYANCRLRLARQAHFMEVEVDTETGEVFVTRVVNVNDVGKVISWEGCEGQQYGGSYMGAGRGLFEEVIHDPVTGVMLNGNLLDYKFATFNDVGPIDTLLVETGLGYGPYGALGIGEDVATVVPALVGPAVQNAIGVWIDVMPLTPDVVLKALGKG
ncbi:MAG: xanthine dehydrogenase family protein molybdopterin-binding subunit [Desulfopila sp.]